MENNETEMEVTELSEENLKAYLDEIQAVPPLSPEEEKDLAQKVANGDKEAENKMAEANLRLVPEIAREYEGRGLEIGKLIMEGNLGLLRAVGQYHMEACSHFAEFAGDYIRQAIEEAMPRRIRKVPAGNLESSLEEAFAGMSPEQISAFADHLTEREQKVVRMRLGQDGCAAKTREETGTELNISAERVRQIEAKIIQKFHCYY